MDEVSRVGHQDVVAETAKLLSAEIDVVVEPRIAYALAHNGFSIVRSLAVANTSSEILQDLTVTVGITAIHDRPIAPTVEFLIDALGPREGLVKRDLRLQLDPIAMAQIDQPTPAEVVVTIRSDESMAVQRIPVELLPYSQWVYEVGMSFNVLPAFVMPNHPAVAGIMLKASDVLLKRTSSGSLEGYQNGPQRAALIAEALFEALSKEDIRYSNPPAGYLEGQRIRTPEEVIDGRLGTCLDLAVTYAACLEQSGLRPVLFVVPGHAFAGFFASEESSLRESVVYATGDIDNLVQNDLVIPVETVALTNDSTFLEALAEGRLRVTEARDDMHAKGADRRSVRIDAMVDIRRSRVDGIKPIPARRREDDGQMIVHVFEGPDVVDADIAPVDEVAIVQSDTDAGPRVERLGADDAPLRIRRWKASLLDLSLRNGLLNFTDRRAAMDLILSGEAMCDLEDRLHRDERIEVRPLTLVTDIEYGRDAVNALQLEPEKQDEVLARDGAVYVMARNRDEILGDPEAYKSRFRALRRKAKRLEEETGSNNLFLVLGTLKWSMTPHREVNPNRDREALSADQQELRSPIYLVPIRIEPSRGGRTFSIHLEEGGFSTPNYCLAEKLRQEFDLDIPDLTEPDLDDAGIDLDVAFRSIREQLLEEGFNFVVDPTAHIAFLDFTTFRLWRDLDLHWRDFMQNPVVKHLVETPNSVFVDPAADDDKDDADALDLYCPVPFDGSQKLAISAAAAGRSFVLEGPPGTGKSQTITNLLANAIATGKKVLFVAEKQAALSIVKDRLDEVGLGSLCLDLHSKGSTTKQIREQLRKSLDLTVERDQAGWDAARQKRLASAAGLRRYPTALHAENNAGYSAWTGYQHSLALGSGASADVSVRTLDLSTDEIAALTQALEDLPSVADAIGSAQRNPWGLSNVFDFEEINRDELTEAIDDLHDALRAIEGQSEISAFLNVPGAESVLEDLALVVETLAGERRVSPRLVREIATREWGWDRDAVLEKGEQFVGAHAATFDVISPDVLGADTATLAGFARQVRDASWMKRRSMRKQLLSDLEPYLQGSGELPKDLEPLLASIDDTHRVLADLHLDLDGLSGCDVADWNPLVDASQVRLDERLAYLDAIRRCVGDDNRALKEVEEIFAESRAITPDLADAVGNLATAWVRFNHIVESDEASIARWVGGRGWITALDSSIGKWRNDSSSSRFLQLLRWSSFITQLELLSVHDLDEFRSAILTGEITPEEASAAFKRGLLGVSHEERFVSEALDLFDSSEHERRIEKFGEADDTLRSLMISEIPGRMLDRRPFDSQHQRGEVGELSRELTRVRGGASIRDLLKRHPEIVLELMPCFLMSPESVARFLDTGGIHFDMVVFDEASQIRVAQAVGALGRADSAVIVGDSKQMPPTTFGIAGMSFDEGEKGEDELLVPIDLESILSEAVESRIPRMWLSWHYRSQAEELIAFSNTHYYDQRLASFPSPQIGRSGYGLVWRRIDGEFQRGHRRVNQQEAQAIVDEVVERVSEDPDVSLGIVTLNIEQMNLIEDMLRELKMPAIDSQMEAPNGIFVKNLEAVQGDERDVILFSVAFSRNRDTGKFPMNFGPLNREGGERRLNVAVTRARKQVVVFCSFDPEDIDLKRTSSLGVRHLRDYLFTVRDGASSDGQTVDSQRLRHDRHRDDIAEKLRARGLRVGIDVGLSEFTVDLAVGLPDEPGHWTLAVLLDGPSWAARHTIHDRDRLPTEVLGKLLNWPRVERVWFPSWLAEEDVVVDRLEHLARTPPEVVAETDADREISGEAETVLEPAAEADRDQANEDDEVLGIERQMQPVASIGPAVSSLQRPAMSAFVPYPNEPLVGTVDELDRLGNPAIKSRVRDVIAAAVAQEGPIQLKRLVQLIGKRFDLHRVSRTRLDQLTDLIDESQIESDALGTFVWPAETDRTAWREYRPSPEGITRDIDEISHRELVNAMEVVVRATYSIRAKELIRDTASIFGMTRLTEKVRTRLEAVVQWAIDENRLASVDGRIRLPSE